MSKRLQLSVPKPCHEDWGSMTPVEKGKFCDSCNKQVVDFTNMNDQQVAQFFKKKSTGSVCGRFFNDQLDRSIEIPKKRIPWLKYFFQFLIPAFLVSCRENIQGKVKVVKTEIISEYSTHTLGEVSSEFDLLPDPALIPDTSTIEIFQGEIKTEIIGDVVVDVPKLPFFQQAALIEGLVIDEENNPIPMANIYVNIFSSPILSDSLGSFSMILEPGHDISSVEIEISSVGFKSKKVEYTDSDSSIFIVQLERDIKALDSVFISAGGITKGSVVLGGAVVSKSSIKSENIVECKPSPIVLFPNPVEKGKVITVKLSTDTQDQLRINIFSSMGQLLSSQTIRTIKGTNQFYINTSIGWSSGTYIVQIVDKNGKKVSTEKILIQ